MTVGIGWVFTSVMSTAMSTRGPAKLGAVAALLTSALLACGTAPPAATPTSDVGSPTHTDALDSIAVMG
jgi:hypothetical protein